MRLQGSNSPFQIYASMCLVYLMYAKRRARLQATGTWHGHGSFSSLGSRPRHLLQGKALTRLSILHQKASSKRVIMHP